MLQVVAQTASPAVLQVYVHNVKVDTHFHQDHVLVCSTFAILLLT